MRNTDHTQFLFERKIAKIFRKQRGPYEDLKRAIFILLSGRPNFVRSVDSSFVEQAARLFADWLYIEELLSSDENKAAVCKYADALAKIHSMLISTFDELEITPKMRNKIFKEITTNDEITLKLKTMIGGN